MILHVDQSRPNILMQSSGLISCLIQKEILMVGERVGVGVKS